MSARLVAPFRPSGALRLQLVSASRYRPRSVELQLWQLHQKRDQMQTTAALSRPHSRCQSTSAKPRGAARHPPPPKATLRKALAATFRNLFSSFRGQNLRTLYQQNPGELVLALSILAGCVGVLAYVVKLYFSYFQSEQFTRYPPEVANSLRRALYFSNYNHNPEQALKYYKRALGQCKEHGLDVFSDDVMGIRIQVAAWLERIGQYEASAKALEALLDDCKNWVEAVEKGLKDGSLSNTLMPPLPPMRHSSGKIMADQPETQMETLLGKRTRVLGKAVNTSIKLGDLYAGDHMLEQDLAHERLAWAVETALQEGRRRSEEGVKEGEGPWMSPEAVGAALESLGHSYEAKSQFQFALPLFFQALRLSPNQCHSAVIMNNLAATFAQHPTDTPVVVPAAPKLQSRDDFLQAARRWAKNALAHAKEPSGTERSSECDEACAVALCNLGDIAAMLGNTNEARRKFEECIAMSKKLDYAPGLAKAEAGLRGLHTA